MRANSEGVIWSLLKRALRWVGGGLGLAGVVFVVARLLEHADKLDFSNFGTIAWAGIGGFAVMYGLANIFLASAWWHILRSFDASVSRLWTLQIYGTSQLAKYVPGNVLHLAARQGLGLAAGLSGGMLAKSLLWEIILLSVTAAVFGVLALPLLWRNGSILLSVLTFVSVMFLLAVGVRRWFGKELAKALACQAGFLLMSGTVFVGILGVVVGKESMKVELLLVYVGAYLLAWLAGLLTPGAPAGAGVREMAVVFLLGGSVAEADLLFAVAMSRAITIAGDLGFSAWALLARRGRLDAQI